MALLRKISSHVPVVSTCIRMFFFGGIMKANGIILNSTVRELNTSNTSVAWAFTLQSSVAYLTSPLGGYLLTYLSNRQVCIIGGFLAGLGYVCSGVYLTDVWQLYIYHSVTGLGLGLQILPNCMYIYENFGCYTEILSIGSGFIYVGVAVLPMTFQWLIDYVGFRGGKACFGALIWNTISIGVLSRPFPETERLVAENKHQQQSNEGIHFLDKYFFFFGSALRHRKLGILLIFGMVSVYIYSSWSIFLVPVGEARGLSTHQAVLLSAVGGVGGIIGSVTSHQLFHYKKMNGYTCCLIPSLIDGIALLMYAFVGDFTLLCAVTLVSGFAKGLEYAGICAIVPSLVCDYHIEGAILASCVSEGIAYQIGGAVSGLIQDTNGSPEMVFVVCSILSFLVSPLAFVWILDGPSIAQCYKESPDEGGG